MTTAAPLQRAQSVTVTDFLIAANQATKKAHPARLIELRAVASRQGSHTPQQALEVLQRVLR